MKQSNLGEMLGNLMGGAGAMTGNQKQEWYKSYHFPETVKFNCHDMINIARSALFSQAVFSEDVIVYENHVRIDLDNISNNKFNMSLTAFLDEIGAKKIYNSKIYSHEFVFYVFDDGAISFNQSGDYGWNVSLTIVTTNLTINNLFDKLKINE